MTSTLNLNPVRQSTARSRAARWWCSPTSLVDLNPKPKPRPAEYSALPRGSVVVLANQHPPAELERTVRAAALRGIGVTHVQLEPLQRCQLSALDVLAFE